MEVPSSVASEADPLDDSIASTVGRTSTASPSCATDGPARLIREAIAIATPAKYHLSAVLDMAPQLCSKHSLIMDLAFPRPKAGDEGAPSTRLMVPLEIVLFRQSATNNVLAVLGDGTLVSFGFWRDEVDAIRRSLTPCIDAGDLSGWGDVERSQTVRYTTIENLPALGFEKPLDVETSYIDEGELDAIVLQAATRKSMIPFIYCLSRRVQIEACSAALQPLAKEVAQGRGVIGDKGSLPFSVKECRAMKAKTMRLLSTQTRIALRPRIFSHHEYSGLRHIYALSCEHFEVTERSDALRARIESAAESLSYMGAEANHRTNHRLEVVICVLIATEIVIHLAAPAEHH